MMLSDKQLKILSVAIFALISLSVVAIIFAIGMVMAAIFFYAMNLI